ncbi:hypothetical protein KK083_09090 [Fulvivirgaceae bacterium PWU4]|uniref:Uncharacterized protein n=1 Tax=Chryseosolibacter histidini TaxID=2782349 RepID=A0AAP2GP45_9BACT|nr:hypothetical protein [Chryseosolibacter histidini]MBT1697027.1 hypothetical protein [Chryseosolibacter histidini]
MTGKIYTPVWSKYRPAILKMMIDSANEPQSYQLSNHEFKALNPKQKGGYTFALQVSSGKALSGLKDSAIAHDLWEILQLSGKASELISNATYEFSMDKQFVLRVNKISSN